MWRIKPVYFSLLVFAGIAAAAWFFFIPAFAGKVVVSPDLHIGPVKLRWYGLLMAVAILAGYTLGRRLAPRFGLEADAIEHALPWLVVGGFLGGRIYYVAFFWEYFGANPQDILAVWKGGLAIYGAIIGGALGLAAFARKRVSAWPLFAVVAVVLPLGQALGRFGNFFNQEAFGSPTSLPWGMYIAPVFRPAGLPAEKFYHPTFLYEALWDFAIFLILLYLSRKAVSARVLVGSYLILYPLGRFFIEQLRMDSFFLGSFRVDQISSLLVMLLGAFIISQVLRHGPKKNN